MQRHTSADAAKPNTPVDAPPPLVRPSETSLFLDFDGTLVELAERPDAVAVDARLRNLLDQSGKRFDGRVAVVSGRSIAQLDALIGTAAADLALVGSHGAEVRLAGTTISAPERPVSLHDAEALFVRTFASEEGVIIEVKTLGVAIHYRLAPLIESAATELAETFASKHALHLQKGKMMVELRAPGHDKGSGIAELMKMVPFRDHRPIFLGDDLTDEPGFAHCEARGGSGILVGAPRATAARYRLDDVAAVHAWLASL